ncbi:hypothetical protein M9H77_22874 [Catharanthus roseus]|uniref:Uncharacterized protein n=1 Tax=Catharanthus roseus TaxID=4058 RepID=A0ACC0AS45_CATRO|nr:hypothetical protein M9H77_22874 [Catharanthus roseus]
MERREKLLKKGSKEEALACCPAKVKYDQWEQLVEYWSMDTVQTAVEIKERPHRCGRKVFAITREEIQEEGEETNSMLSISEEAANVINSMKERLMEFLLRSK